MTGNFCEEHTKLITKVANIETDVKWLRKDREEQKEAIRKSIEEKKKEAEK
jgi:hypothetical protein